MTDLRQTIELLRKQSIQAGLTSAHMQSMGSCSSISTAAGGGVAGNPGQKMAPSNNNSSPMHNHSSPGYAMGTPVRGIPQSSSTLGGDPMMNAGRHLSSDSMCSLNSISSGCSTQDKKKKKGWVSDLPDEFNFLFVLPSTDGFIFHYSFGVPSLRPSRGMQRLPRPAAM